MIHHRIIDFTDAYANGKYIAGGDRWPSFWADRAAAWRDREVPNGRARIGISYGPHARNRYDLFLPEGKARGLAVYVHGGYWMSLDPSFWSHLAAGSLAHGYAVAVPGYVLCPEVRISAITAQIGVAIAHAAGQVDGPIQLSGHSAGGHLVTRMITEDTPLPPEVLARVANVTSISGLHDLRPLLKCQMNKTLRLDAAEAAAESPVLLRPAGKAKLSVWVGGSERSEFIRQSALLANMWTGLGVATGSHVEPDRHHFDVVDGLELPESALTRTFLGL